MGSLKANPNALPPVMRRGIVWTLALSMLFVLAAIAWVALRRSLGLPRGGWFRYVPMVLGLMPILVLMPLWVWRTRRIRRAIVASGGRLCTHCAYDVSKLPDPGTCPECGKRFEFAVDKQAWENVGALYG